MALLPIIRIPYFGLTMIVFSYVMHFGGFHFEKKSAALCVFVKDSIMVVLMTGQTNNISPMYSSKFPFRVNEIGLSETSSSRLV